jgi:hypothetical protein
MKISQPVRVERSYVQSLAGTPKEVFPLLCPVRETEWVNGWDPLNVWSESGAVEPGCVFVMPGEPAEAIWVTLRHDPAAFAVEFVKVTPGHTVGRISIRLSARGEKETAAQVSYEYTALSEEGERFVAEFTEDRYAEFMREWEGELNHFLATGRKRPPEAS